MAFKLIIISTALLVAFINAQSPEEVSRVCLGCICEAISGCNTTVGCNGDVCGPFRITWGYWFDSGKPTVGNEVAASATAYPNCANDAACAAKIVQGYMAKYATDCNGDGRINCDDYIRIHSHGPYGCQAPLDPKLDNIYTQCVRVFSQQ